METLLQNLRYAIRRLAAAPGFTAVAALTLALGIGANTAIFSVVDGVLLRPLPYSSPERLYTLPHNLSPPELADAAAMARSFESVGGAALNPFDIQTGSEPVQGIAAMASGALFETLGARAALGRTLARADDRPGGERVVVLGHSLWQSIWGGDRGSSASRSFSAARSGPSSASWAPSSRCPSRKPTSTCRSGWVTRPRRRSAGSTSSAPSSDSSPA